MMREYTVKEIADLLGVSKPAIQKKVKELGITCRMEKNRQVYQKEDVIRIIEVMRPGFDYRNHSAFSDQMEIENGIGNSKTESENSKTENEKTESAIGNSETKIGNSKTENDNQTLSILKSALESLQSQLAEKDRQIKDLNDRLADEQRHNREQNAKLSELVKGQQALLAAEKMQKQESEDQVVVDEQDEVKHDVDQDIQSQLAEKELEIENLKAELQQLKDSQEQKQAGNEVVSEVVESTVDQQPEDPEVAVAAAEDTGRTEEPGKGRWWKRLFSKR